MMSTRVGLALCLGLFSSAGCLSSFDAGPGAGGDMAVPGGDPAVGAPGGGGGGGAGATAKAYFDPDIQADLDHLGCTNSACHGGGASPVVTAAPSSPAAWSQNFSDIKTDCTTLDCLGGGVNALLLTKPLVGGPAHTGPKPFASTSDPTYQRWLAWIGAGAPYSAAGPPPASDMALAPSGTPDMKSNESMTITFTTQASPSAGQSRYDPKNVVAVWIETPTGAFVKTIGRWANVRRNQLVDWYAKAGLNDVDAISSATQPSYGTLTAKWDMTARQQPAPALPAPADGTYTIRLELADNDVTSAAQNNEGTFTFTRNGKASSQTNLSNGGFTKVTIDYTGR